MTASEVKLPKSYDFVSPKGSEIQSALAAQCIPGKTGEFLVREGCNQLAVTRFAARLAIRLSELGENEDSITSVFRVLSIANASALSQNLAKLEIDASKWTDEAFALAGGKMTAEVKDAKTGAVTSAPKRIPLLVAHYWSAKGGKAAATPTASALSRL